MNELLSILLFFGIVAAIFMLLLTKDRNFLRKFLEDPKVKVKRRYLEGKISYEEYQKKMAYLEACG